MRSALGRLAAFGREREGVAAVEFALLTPLVLVVSLFADRKRTLHDLLLGTVVTRSDV